MFIILRRWGVTLIILPQLSSRIRFSFICFFVFRFKVTELVCRCLPKEQNTFGKSTRAFIHMIDVRIDVEPFEPVVWYISSFFLRACMRMCVRACSKWTYRGLLQLNIHQKHPGENSPTWPRLRVKLRPAAPASWYGVLLLHTSVAATEAHCTSRRGNTLWAFYTYGKCQPPFKNPHWERKAQPHHQLADKL